ncbi:MAG TPA: hypothetical protein P5262_01495 [Candidatus Moranbacteria bacterium]|nr:hypothetical protein [Candidatus Moranbacteria bacterium]
MNKKINPPVAIAIILFTASVFAFFLFKINDVEAPGEINVVKEAIKKTELEKSEAAKNEKVSSEDLTKDWLEYKNYKYGYKIKFSKAMTVNDKNLDDVMISLPISSDVIIPFEIKVIPTGKNYDLDAMLKKALAKDLEGGRSLNKEEIVIDGEKGYALSSCGKFECVTQKWAAVKDGRLYILRSIDGLPKDFELVFSTFRFIR